jgi:ribosomal-protein-alanine N-acetyltransferase
MQIDLGDGFRIRPLEENDIAALVKYAGNPRVAEQLEDRFPHPYTVGDARRWLATLATQDPLTNFAIVSPHEMIGGIGLDLREDVYFRTAEIGYWLGEPFWGQGIATSAVRAMTRWSFDNLNLVRLEARVFETNPASGRVLEKAGFACEGRLRKSVTKEGKTMDQTIYAVLDPGRNSEATS